MLSRGLRRCCAGVLPSRYGRFDCQESLLQQLYRNRSPVKQALVLAKGAAGGNGVPGRFLASSRRVTLTLRPSVPVTEVVRELSMGPVLLGPRTNRASGS